MSSCRSVIVAIVRTIKRSSNFAWFKTSKVSFQSSSCSIKMIRACDLSNRDCQQGRHLVYVGYVVTKKLGTAVQRNRVRRRIKEAVRLVFPKVAQLGCSYLLIPHRSSLTCPFDEIKDDLKMSLICLNNALTKCF